MADYELRDPIHKRITFDEFEREVIDHPFFQRLRFIGQLSLLQSYVYPGATHNRFTHALGAMHVAGRLFGRVVQGSEAITERLSHDQIFGLRRRLRLAGLLHDVGHGPFSHESESVFPMLSTLALDWTWWKEGKPTDRQATHEDFSVLLIQTLAREGVLEKEFAQDVASFVHGSVKPSAWFAEIDAQAPTLQKILKQLISGEADCDRMDYLLRDSYYCGVAYGNYDIDWLISSMSVQEVDGRLALILAENGMRAFEAFLLARYHMFDQVYLHKTKSGFLHCLTEAIQTREIPLQIPSDAYAYADMRDGRVIEMLFDAAKRPQNYWSIQVARRLPPRRILRLQESRPEDMQLLEELTHLCETNNIRYFVRRAGKELSTFGEYGTAPEMFVARQRIGETQYVPIAGYSDLLQKYNEKIRVADFFVLREDAELFVKCAEMK